MCPLDRSQLLDFGNDRKPTWKSAFFSFVLLDAFGIVAMVVRSDEEAVKQEDSERRTGGESLLLLPLMLRHFRNFWWRGAPFSDFRDSGFGFLPLKGRVEL